APPVWVRIGHLVKHCVRDGSCRVLGRFAGPPVDRRTRRFGLPTAAGKARDENTSQPSTLAVRTSALRAGAQIAQALNIVSGGRRRCRSFGPPDPPARSVGQSPTALAHLAGSPLLC